MGFKLQDDEEIISDINVTPFVDVMLVLLVIFMISAPLLFNGLDLTLPKTKKVTALQLKNNQIILSISETGALYLNDKKILYQELINLIKERMEIEKAQTVYIRADYRVKYGEVARTMAVLKSSGITQISLVTDTEK